MRTTRALVAVLGLRRATTHRVLGKAVRRWSGMWTLLMVLNIVRIMRRRQRRVIIRRVLREGEVLVISNSVTRDDR